jgi:hypothetical protein
MGKVDHFSTGKWISFRLTILMPRSGTTKHENARLLACAHPRSRCKLQRYLSGFLQRYLSAHASGGILSRCPIVYTEGAFCVVNLCVLQSRR